MGSGTKIILFFLVIITGYFFVSCFYLIDDNSFGIVKETETGEYVRLLDSGPNLVYEGAIPGRTSVITANKKSTEFFKIIVPLFPSEELQDIHSIQVPVSIVFVLQTHKYSINLFRSTAKKHRFFAGILEKLLKGYFNKEFADYISPLYRRGDLIFNMEKITSLVKESMVRQGERIGLEIADFQIVGNVFLPDVNTYYDGIRYYNELVEIKKNNKKELIILRNKLIKEKYRSESLYQKLGEISRLIKSNPDILKYMYIEKMSDKVKVIISPDRSGMPFGLDLSDGNKKVNTKGEIDNLR